MTPSAEAEESDYGSDLDEDDAFRILTSTERGGSEQESLRPVLPETVDGDERAPAVHIPRSPSSSQPAESVWTSNVPAAALPTAGRPPTQEELELFGSTQDIKEGSPGRISFETEPPGTSDTTQDTRSPLERFRRPPKKPLSVTDIVSPAWCELQYWYSLTKYGKIKRTPQMKRGTEVHKVLEEKVHTTVPIETKTREDIWGLRIWNVIQGLRCLRVTGMTREFEIWGVIDGQVINGIIDELSFHCTDPELEDKLAKKVRLETKQPPPDQSTISQFFGGNNLETRLAGLESRVSGLESTARLTGKAQGLDRKVYLMDVKTRGSTRLPNATAMRPTHMQLSLYRHLLSELASNAVNADILFDRYKLDPSRSFSDAMIAQLSGLDFNFSGSQTGSEEALMESTEDTVGQLLAHNSLRQLWELMTLEFHRTMPGGPESISKVLKVEFRSSHDSSIVGVKTFPFNDEVFETYMADVMQWWKGERPPKGVDVEEAFKCQMCEFADGCEWRQNKVDDAMKRSRAKAPT